jgi:hypothetical protein
MSRHGLTLSQRLAARFKESPNTWIDGRELTRYGGYAGYRGRLSDIRRPPFSMVIENRMRRITVNGEEITVSEYRFIEGSPPRMSVVEEAGDGAVGGTVAGEGAEQDQL